MRHELLLACSVRPQLRERWLPRPGISAWSSAGFHSPNQSFAAANRVLRARFAPRCKSFEYWPEAVAGLRSARCVLAAGAIAPAESGFALLPNSIWEYST